MMDDKDKIAAASIEGAAAPKRKRSPAKRKTVKGAPGRKTLIAAVAASLLALTDLFLTVRLGINLW